MQDEEIHQVHNALYNLETKSYRPILPQKYQQAVEFNVYVKNPTAKTLQSTDFT